MSKKEKKGRIGGFTEARLNYLVKDPKSMGTRMEALLLNPNPSSFQGFMAINRFQQEQQKSRPQQKQDPLLASQTAAQEFLKQMASAKKSLAQKIDTDLEKIIKEYKNKTYSNLEMVDKIYQLLKDLNDYKLKFLSYTYSNEKMVTGLNFFIEVINQLYPKEMITLIQELPAKYIQCIKLLIQMALELPPEYSCQVNTDLIKLPEAKSSPVAKSDLPRKEQSTPKIAPSPQELPAQNRASKYAAAKAKKKAKKFKNSFHEEKNNPGLPKIISKTSQSNAQFEPDITFESAPEKLKLASILIKESNCSQKRKENKIKHVHWEDKEKKKLKVSQQDPVIGVKNSLELVAPEPVQLTSELKKEKSVSQKSFFWSEQKKNSPSITGSTTTSVNMKEKINRTYKNGQVREEIIDRTISFSQQHEVKFEPLPRVYFESVPVVKVTEFALPSSRMVSCLQSMQAATIELAQLMLVNQPLNDITLEKYSNHVISYHNYVQSLSESMYVSSETDYQCPVNPNSILEILKDNWEMHEAFANLFKDSSVMPDCIALRSRTFKLLQQFLPPGYWVTFEEGFVIEPRYILTPENKNSGYSSASSNLWNSRPVQTENSNPERDTNSCSY